MVGMAEIVFQNPWGLVALPIGWLLLLLFAWRRRFQPFIPFLLRLVIIVLIGLALAQPVRLRPEAGDQPLAQRLVILVDQSASLGETGRQALRAEATRLTRDFPDSITLFFADRPVIVLPFSPALIGSQPLPDNPPAEIAVDLDALTLDLEISNLADALTLGAKLLDDKAGRLILLSDGLPTRGDALEATTQLARQGIPVDVVTVDEGMRATWAATTGDVRLVKLDVPPVLRQGETYDIEVVIHSTEATDVNLRLTQLSQDKVLAEDVIAVDEGLNLYTFAATAEALGPQTFRADIAADGDAEPANNSYSAWTQVFAPSRVLLVGEDQLQVDRFKQQLEEAGYIADQIRPAGLPDRLSPLESYTGMVMLNVSARSLELEQMVAVQEFVRSLGRGLLVTGGRESFSLGHYADTPLADLLPLTLEPPPREERPPVALLLIIDHSGSMIEEDTPTKLAMAKAAAIRATDILGPEDLLGILIFDNRYEWVIPFQPVSDGATLLHIQESIAAIPPGGGTRILQAMQIGLPALAEQKQASGGSHAVLFTDGKSFDGSSGIAEYDQTVDAALEANITLSTIAIGNDADIELLGHLAERGLGRYHFAAAPDELPALTIAESDILRSNAVQEGEFRPSLAAPHSIVRGLFNDSPDSQDIPLPDLTGYIAMTPKPRSEIALQIGPGDPLLSVWGYGLGRVAAWSSDTGHEWAGQWPSSAEATRFWGQVLGYTLPAPDLGLLQLKAEEEPNGRVTLIADSLTGAGETVDLARTQATVTTPGGREIPVSLRQISPGRYQQQLQLADPGAYVLRVNQLGPGQAEEATATLGFVVPYPAEYALPAEGAGETLLTHIATTTGGHPFTLGSSPLPGSDCDAAVDDCTPDQPLALAQNAEPVIELWPWLLGLALILWPVEIAWRRWSRLRIQ
jgi:Mg-chelatase subunit ChlD